MSENAFEQWKERHGLNSSQNRTQNGGGSTSAKPEASSPFEQWKKRHGFSGKSSANPSRENLGQFQGEAGAEDKRRARAKHDLLGSEVDVDYINGYLDDHYSYWSGYGSGEWVTDEKAGILGAKRENIDKWLEDSLTAGTIDQEWYDEVMGILGQADTNAGMAKVPDLNAFYTDFNNWYSSLGAGEMLTPEQIAPYQEQAQQWAKWANDNREALGEETYAAIIQDMSNIQTMIYKKDREWKNTAAADGGRSFFAGLMALPGQEDPAPQENFMFVGGFEPTEQGAPDFQRMIHQGMVPVDNTEDVAAVEELIYTTMPYTWEEAERQGYSREGFDYINGLRQTIAGKYDITFSTTPEGAADNKGALEELLDDLNNGGVVSYAPSSAPEDNIYGRTMDMVQGGIDQANKQAGWWLKYSDMSYYDLQLAIDKAEDPAEKAWLQQYAPTRMTDTDYGVEVGKLNTQIAQKEDELEELWRQYGGKQKDPLNWLPGQMAGLEAQIKALEEEIMGLKRQKGQLEQDRQWATLHQNEDWSQMSRVTQTEATSNGTPFGGGDHTYDYINFLDGTAEDHDTEYELGNTTQKMRLLDFMTDDERQRYNYIYNKEGKERAEEYLEYLEVRLSQRSSQARMEDMRRFTQTSPVAANILIVGGSLAGGLGYLDVGAQKLWQGMTGDYKPINYWGTMMQPTLLSRTAQKTTAQMITDATGTIQLYEKDHPILAPILNGRGLADVYLLGMSAIDSKVAAMTGNPYLATALLAGSAATNGVLDALEHGATDEQALQMGMWNGVFEALFEFAEVDNLLKGDPSWIKAVANQAITEGFGEGFTSVANNLADFLIMADKSELERTVAELMANDPELSEEAAYRKALVAMAVGIGWDIVGGAVSGGISAGGASLSNHINTQIQYQQLPAELRRSAERLESYGVDKTTAIDRAGVLYELWQKYGDQAGSFQLAYDPKRDVYDYARDFSAAWEIGRNNGNVDYLQKLTGLSDSQRKIAYELGVAAQGQKKTDTAKTGSRTETAKTASGTAAAAPGQENVKSESTGASTETAAYEVSEDGRDHLISDPGRSISVKEIASVEDGKVTLRLEDGSTVDAEDVSFGDESDALIYWAVADMGVNASAANVLMDAYHTGGDVSASDYAMGIREAYWYGRNNIPFKEIGTGSAASTLTEHQRKTAYRLGELFGGRQTAQEEAAARKSREGAKADAKRSDETGKVHFDRKGRTFDDIRETALKTMEQLSKALGIEFYIYESYVNDDGKRVYRDASGKEVSAPNGFYDPKDGSIHIDLNAGNDGKGVMLFTIAHELTHFIRQWSPAKFRVLANFLMKQYGERGVSVSELVDRQIAKTKANGRSIDRDAAYEEVVADSMEAMLADGNVVQMMADLKQQDKTLWEKLRDWFKDLTEDLKKLVAAYKGVKPETAEGRMVADMQDVIVVLESLYADALVEAGENYRASEGNKKTTREGGTNEVKDVLYSERNDIVDVNGKEYDSVVMLDKPVPKRVLSDQRAFSKFLVGNLFNKKISVLDKNGDVEIIEFAGEKERVTKNGNRHQVRGELEYAKGSTRRVIIANLEEVAKYSSYDPVFSSDDNSHGWLDKNGWESRRTYVTDGDTVYEAYLKIGKSSDGRNILYAVNCDAQNGIAVDKGATSKRAAILSAMPSGGTLSYPGGSVKPESTEKRSDRDPTAAATAAELEKQNVKLRKDVAELRRMLGMQGKLTRGTEFRRSSIEAAVKSLAQTAGATLDGDARKQLYDMLRDFYKYIASEKELTWEGVTEEAGKIADFLQSHVKIKPEMSDYAKDVLRQIRGQKITLDEKQMAEVEHLYGSYEAFRKTAFGSVTFVKQGGISLDSFWHEMASMFPGTFDENLPSNDQPQALLDAVHDMRSSDTNVQEYAYNRAFIRQDLIQAVYDSYWKVDNLHTVADKKQKEINEIRAKHRQQMEELRTDRDNAIRQLKEKRTADIESVREGYKKVDMRRQIRKTIRELEKLLVRGDKKRNVKEGMQDLVATALASAEVLFTDSYTVNDMIRSGVGVTLTDGESKLLNEAMDILAELDNAPAVVDEAAFIRWKREEDLKRKLNEIKRQLQGVFERERIRLEGTTASALLQDLADAYEGLTEAEESYIREAFDENVYKHLLELKKGLGYASVKDMRLDQLEALHEAYTAVLTTVRNANKLFDENVKETRQELANKVILEERIAARNKPKTAAGREISKFMWNNLKPVYAFERIGSQTLARLYGNIRKGQDTWAKDMNEADTFRREIQEKYGFNSWDLGKSYTFTTGAGKEVELTLGQIMSVYAYTRRAQAHDHILKGGFVLDGSTTTTVNKLGIKVQMLKEDATAYKMSPETLAEIIGTLDEAQTGYVEEMQKYLSETMGEKGNSVSMKLYGIKLFKEANYFPLRSAGQYMARAKEADLKKEQGQTNLASSGFTKAVAPKASNPVILSDFMDVWAGHVNEMSMYHGFVLPMEDFRRVYNYSTPNLEDQDSDSVNAAIQNAHGAAATAYIDQLYRDLNGGALSDSREGIAKAMVGRFKKAATVASLSVVFQQPSSIGRAFALIDPKHFEKLAVTRGVGRAVFNKKRHDKLWAELKRYAPVAMIKEMGYFDTGMGRSAVEFLQAKEYSGIREKAKAFFTDSGYRDELLTKPAAVADELTWVEIWQAVKNETADRHPDLDRSGEEFLKIAGDRFAEVIDRTQVYDSVLARSANMRSKSLYMNMATSFMAEPTTTMNMVWDALTKAAKGQKKAAARVIGSVAVSIVLNAALSSLVYAARDDDEDETYLEKYLSSFLGSMLDGFNPLTYIPFLKDIWSLAQGYDVERADMSLMSDLMDVLRKLVKAYNEDTSGMSDEQLKEHDRKVAQAWWNAADVVANLFGIPMKNIRREINGAANLYGTLWEDFSGRKTTWMSLGDALLEEIRGATPVWGWLPGETKAEKLLDAILAGDREYAERIMGSYKTPEAAEAAVKKVVKEAYLAGEVDKQTARQLIINYGGVDVIDAYWTLDEWGQKKLDPSGDTDYSKYDRFYAAVETGADIKTVIQEYVDNGVDMETLRRQISTYFKPVYTGMSASGRTELKGHLINAMELCGQDRAVAEASLKKWDFEAQTGYSWDDRGDAYKNGAITADGLIKAMMDISGKTREEAALQIEVYDWQKEIPNCEITAGGIKDYRENCEGLGISRSTFYTAWSFYMETNGEVDENGESIPYSKAEKVIPYIGSLPLTANQKTALASCWWGASTVNKYKTW